MSIANIACSALDCQNPVIGQCSGYKKPCGKYYCREHSVDAFCADCANRKAEDDHTQLVYQDYLSTAEGLEKEAQTTITFGGLWKQGVKIAAIIGFFGGPIVFPLNMYPQNFASGVGYFFLGFIVGPMFMAALFIHPFTLLIIWAVLASKRGNWLNTEQANKINETKPGFFEFYTTWRKEKSREKLTTVLTIAGAIAVGAVAAGLSESEYDRTRRAVRDEMNSR